MPADNTPEGWQEAGPEPLIRAKAPWNIWVGTGVAITDDGVDQKVLLAFTVQVNGEDTPLVLGLTPELAHALSHDLHDGYDQFA